MQNDELAGLIDLANSHIQKREFRSAMDAVKEARIKFGNTAATYQCMGLINYYLGMKSESFAILLHAHILDQKNPDIVVNLSEVARSFGSIWEMIPLIRKALDANPSDKDLQVLLAQALLSQQVEKLPEEIAAILDNTIKWPIAGRVRESVLAHKYLDGLRGIEIGGSASNAFGLNTINIDYTPAMTVYKLDEIRTCGDYMPVDIVAFGEKLPFTDNSWDFIVTSHVLEHIANPIKGLLEWHRVIRPGGFLFLLVPHKERMFDKDLPRTTLEELIKRFETDFKSTDYGHHNIWITEDLVEVVKYLNFNIVEVQDIDDKVGNGFTVVVQKNGGR